MAKSKELRQREAKERQAKYDKEKKTSVTIPITQVVNGLPINGGHLYVHRPEELLSFIEGGKNGEPEHRPEYPFAVKKDPEYDLMLKRKADEVFFLRSAKMMSDKYSWQVFLNGASDQGGISYARVINNNNISF